MKFLALSTVSAILVTLSAGFPVELPADLRSQCEEVPNCEVYDSGEGLRIRFKAGMEPGSDDYKTRFPNETTSEDVFKRGLEKRTTKTNLQMGGNSLEFGTKNPADAYKNGVNQLCQSVSCDATMTWTEQSSTILAMGSGTFGSTQPGKKNLVIQARGQFNGIEARNNFRQAVVNAAAHGQQWTLHEWKINVPDYEDSGTQWWGKQSNYISVNKIYNGALAGFLEVWVVDQKISVIPGWCSQVNGLLGAAGVVTGAVNGIAGGFFGAVNSWCA